MCYIADEFAANTKCRLLFANSSGRPLSPSLLSGHGREVVVGGESLDRFRCPAPSDCRPGTAPQVWSCCTLANPLARRRGPRWSPRRSAQGEAAVRWVLCARLQLLHFLLKRVHRPGWCGGHLGAAARAGILPPLDVASPKEISANY